MQGYVHIYTGNGKGKTTAALGLALRAAGAGLKVYLGQFLKKGDFSEIKALRRFPEITVRQFGCGHFVKGRPTAAEIAAARRGLASLRKAMLSGVYTMIIADEANCAVTCGLISVDDLLQLVVEKPAAVELVFTGRSAHPRLIKQADMVSVIQARKHPFNVGVKCRKGIEW
ncbi:MAG: cob(I)yrinic acid a,c-diamide adenosyltransferase [Kiritimatiellaeota bacterium]|nr:cob(I)yrinic acid a,c-diamide adenosyltransferase [Kiritimatiellota bacterium]